MIPVNKVMTKEVITVRADTPIYDALHLLKVNKISGLPVIKDDRTLIGMLTEKDVLQILINPKVAVNATVEQYMTRKLVTFVEEDDIIDICKFFIRMPFRRVPIVRDGKLVGIVSRRDIVGLILQMRDEISDYRFS